MSIATVSLSPCLPPPRQPPSRFALGDQGYDQVLVRRKRIVRPHDLKGPRDAQAGDLVSGQPGDLFVAEKDPPAVGPDEARDAVDQSRLARPVRPYDAVDLAPAHVEAHVDERLQTAEGFADASYGENDGFAHGLTRLTPSPPSRIGDIFAGDRPSGPRFSRR
jgi:hypothetical protein